MVCRIMMNKCCKLKWNTELKKTSCVCRLSKTMKKSEQLFRFLIVATKNVDRRRYFTEVILQLTRHLRIGLWAFQLRVFIILLNFVRTITARMTQHICKLYNDVLLQTYAIYKFLFCFKTTVLLFSTSLRYWIKCLSQYHDYYSMLYFNTFEKDIVPRYLLILFFLFFF